MHTYDHKAILISDFTLDNFAGYLNNDQSFPRIQSIIAPFGQVMQVLMNESLDCWKTDPELGMVWTRPEAVIEAFNKTLQFERVELEEILQQVDAYCQALQSLQQRLRWVFIPTWILPGYHRGLGALDLRAHGGIAYTLMHMNLRLAQNLNDVPNCLVLDAQRWVANAGHKAFNAKLWYLGKIPFANDVFKEAVRDFKAGVRGLSGKGKKLIILDLDETLWSGIVGDVGWQNIVLGGHDPVGEALVDFQIELKALKNRGILLAVVSKNEESVALEAIGNHPEMVLREEDLAGWKINWQDKAQNIVELVDELNLGLDAAVFIDDNPVERARVGEALPDVFVPDWPQDKLLYRQTLLSLDCFDSGFISSEDRQRTKMYTAERQRSQLKSTVGSLEEWLKSLHTQVTVESLNDVNLGRVTQLFNKTNQMNLSTRKMTSAELSTWTSAEGRRLFAFRVSDKFGDSGLIGIVTTEVQQETLHIVDFVFSCRVMGRNVEETMLSIAIAYGQAQGLKKVCARYIPTKKNKPCFDFLLNSRLARGPEDIFSWDLSKEYLIPPHIEVYDTSCMSNTP
jgi:FkbH-like protein